MPAVLQEYEHISMALDFLIIILMIGCYSGDASVEEDDAYALTASRGTGIEP